MSDKKKAVKKGMSFEPEVVGSGPEGEHVVTDANHYVMLHSASQGNLYYCPRDNKYYLSESEEECPAELFEGRFLPYLRWDFDRFEDKVMTDGSVIKKSLFPATPENIAKKRAELMEEAVADSKTPDMKEIIQATLPRELRLNRQYEALIDHDSPNERLLRRINRSL